MKYRLEYDIPKDKVLISLAPGSKRKRGSHYDLAMTIALLSETDQIVPRVLVKYIMIGELSLNGRIRSCSGVLKAGEGLARVRLSAPRITLYP